MTPSLLPVGTGLALVVAGYTAGRLRPLHRIDDLVDAGFQWAQRASSSPRPAVYATAQVILWTAIGIAACRAPIVTWQGIRAIRARRAYTRQLPPEVTTAAIAAVAAHRPNDAERFFALAVPVFDNGRHDLTNVKLLSKELPGIYLTFGDPHSTGLGGDVEPTALATSTQGLDKALTTLQPPQGTLVISLKDD